jgi:hypothetical protein
MGSLRAVCLFNLSEQTKKLILSDDWSGSFGLCGAQSFGASRKADATISLDVSGVTTYHMLAVYLEIRNL